MNQQAIYCKEEIFQLIPQRPPIVMVDKFFGIEENRSFSGLTIAADQLFCQNNQFQEAGIIEHIAQSAAARIGYLCLLTQEEVPLGFIGSVDKLKIHLLPTVGMELFTEITIVQEVGNITLIAALVKANEQVIAECQMKIFIKKE